MHKARHIVAVTLVATALCADRAVAAAGPASLRPDGSMMSMAGRLVSRLSSNFRRVVPSVRLLEPRVRDGVALSVRVHEPQAILVDPLPLNPFQFRLPPPAR